MNNCPLFRVKQILVCVLALIDNSNSLDLHPGNLKLKLIGLAGSSNSNLKLYNNMIRCKRRTLIVKDRIRLALFCISATFPFQWDVFRPQSLNTFTSHEGVCYAAIWSPRIPRCFASTSGRNYALLLWMFTCHFTVGKL